MRLPKWFDVKEVRHWATLRCEHCGLRFRWKRDARHSFGNRDGKVYHGPCMAYLNWRAKAQERMFILDILCDISGLSNRDVESVVSLRARDETERVADSDVVFRVFYDKSKSDHLPVLGTGNEASE